MEEKFFGHPVIRKEGRGKVTGRARYVDDLAFPEMLHGVTVRSSIARGRIRGIRFGDGIPWSEFTVVTAADITGKNEIALIEHDQPCLAAEVINHPEEAIVLLAHPDRYLLEEARRAAQIEADPLPAIFSIEDSLAKTVVIFGEDNVFKSYRVDKGDVDAAWAQADVIVEGEYRTGAQEQLYIENQGMIATANSTDGVTGWGSRHGKTVPRDIDFVIDGGAHAPLSSVVLSRGTIHAAGPYSCPNVRVHSRAVATNAPPHGAFRGFGAPQSIFAIERHMDHVARAVNLTPEEFRRRNFLHKDQTTATGQVIHEAVDFEALLDRAFRESDY